MNEELPKALDTVILSYVIKSDTWEMALPPRKLTLEQAELAVKESAARFPERRFYAFGLYAYGGPES